MTTELISRRNALVGTMGTVVAGSLTLAGCGGGGGGGNSGSAQLRALNLTSDLPTLDLFTDDTSQFTGLTLESLTAYKGVDGKEYTLRVKKTGDGATLLSGTYTLGKDQNFTAVIWGRETGLRLSTLPENENNDSIGTGNSRVRMFNATTDSGSVDIFFTTATADLGETAPTQPAVGSGSLSGFRELSAGTYRLRVTGTGDPSDVRLDISGVVLATKQHYNLVLTAGAGGVLLNGVLIQQQATAVTMRNTKSRVRLVASVDTAGVVAASVPTSTTPTGGVLSGGQRSPSLGRYLLVDAGTRAVEVRVNGTLVSSANRVFAAGADYTMLVAGSAAAPTISLIADDNRLPALATRVKMRVIHGANGVAPITLSADFLPLATEVAFGTGSAYATTASGTAVGISVTSPSAVAPLFERDAVNLLGQSVYTVFLLGGNATVQGVINKER